MVNKQLMGKANFSNPSFSSVLSEPLSYLPAVEVVHRRRPSFLCFFFLSKSNLSIATVHEFPHPFFVCDSVVTTAKENPKLESATKKQTRCNCFDGRGTQVSCLLSSNHSYAKAIFQGSDQKVVVDHNLH
ncbi:hypothetical protein V2J09_014207 [Rumex salicifolius]